MQAKKYDRAIAILAKHNWWDKLITVVREVPKDDKKDLITCAQHFRKVRSLGQAHTGGVHVAQSSTTLLQHRSLSVSRASSSQTHRFAFQA